MTELIEAFSVGLGRHWSWLAGSSIKATAWLLVVLAILQLLRKSSAGWRHMISVGGAIGVPLIFLLNLSLIPDELGWRPFVRNPIELSEVRIMYSTQVEAMDAPFKLTGALEADPAAAAVSSASFDARTGIVALWWLGCIVVGLRLLLRLRTPRVSQLTAAPAALKIVLDRECGLMDIRPIPALLTSPKAMPMVYGLRRAAIILPTGAIEWSTAKLTSIIRHELAHLRRRDVFWSMMVEAALLPVWWNPFARVLRRRALEWTEQACDDAVINTGVAPTQYATDLLSLSLRNALIPTSAHGLAALSKPGQQARFERVLAEGAERGTISSRKAAITGLLTLGLLILATLFVSCSSVPKDATARDQRVAIAPVVNIPRAVEGAEQIRLSVKIFEVDFPSDEELEKSTLADWIAGRKKLLAAADGAELFDLQRPGSDILSAPHIVTEPGRQAKLEIGSLVPLSGEDKPEFAKVGIEIDSVVWPTGETNTLKVDLTNSTREVVGHEPDEGGFDVPQIRHLQGKYQGLLPNGSYLLIGQPMQPVLLRDKVPVLGDIPLLGRMFRSSRVGRERKVVAAQFSFSKSP